MAKAKSGFARSAGDDDIAGVVKIMIH
jgi:hypothetical protein